MTSAVLVMAGPIEPFPDNRQLTLWSSCSTANCAPAKERAGFVLRPGWAALRDGARAPVVSSAEPGEWQHGWQYRASSASEHHFRETMVLSLARPVDQAHLRSHSGPGSSSILLGAPTNFEFRLIPEHFRTLVLERLRLPLSVVEARCECGMLLDSLGRHRAACPPFSKAEEESSGPRENLGKGVQGGRSHSEVQRQAKGR